MPDLKHSMRLDPRHSRLAFCLIFARLSLCKRFVACRSDTQSIKAGSAVLLDQRVRFAERLSPQTTGSRRRVFAREQENLIDAVFIASAVIRIWIRRVVRQIGTCPVADRPQLARA